MAVDTKKLRELAQELGYWPATTDAGDIARHRRLNAALDRAPSLEQVAAKNRHHDVARERQAAKDRAIEDLKLRGLYW